MSTNHLVKEKGNWRVSYCGKNCGGGVITTSPESLEQLVNLPPYKNYVVICPKCFFHFLKIRKAKRPSSFLLTAKMIYHNLVSPVAYVISKDTQ